MINKLSGRSKKPLSIQLNSDGNSLSDSELVSAMNTVFTSVNADIPSLARSSLPAYLPSPDVAPTIFPHD